MRRREQSLLAEVHVVLPQPEDLASADAADVRGLQLGELPVDSFLDDFSPGHDSCLPQEVFLGWGHAVPTGHLRVLMTDISSARNSHPLVDLLQTELLILGQGCHDRDDPDALRDDPTIR